MAFSEEQRKESWMTDPRYQTPEILYENADLLFLNKPAGVLSQKAKEQDFSANEQLLRYLYEQKIVTEESLSTFRPAICNRLDRNTSGILIGGKTLAGLQEAAKLLKERSLEKIYHAIVYGSMLTSLQTEAYLTKDTRLNLVTVTAQKRDGASLIRTDYTPLEGGKDWTLLSIRLHTGKTHQIRAHLQFLGFPVIGDLKYKDPAARKKISGLPGVSRQMLHARECTLPDKTRITAPYPPDFSRVLEALRKIG